MILACDPGKDGSLCLMPFEMQPSIDDIYVYDMLHKTDKQIFEEIERLKPKVTKAFVEETWKPNVLVRAEAALRECLLTLGIPHEPRGSKISINPKEWKGYMGVPLVGTKSDGQKKTDEMNTLNSIYPGIDKLIEPRSAASVLIAESVRRRRRHE